MTLFPTYHIKLAIVNVWEFVDYAVALQTVVEMDLNQNPTWDSWL